VSEREERNCLDVLVAGAPLLEPDSEYPNTRARLAPDARAAARAARSAAPDESVATAVAAAMETGGGGRTRDPPPGPSSDWGGYKLGRLGVAVR
jgi:hypothetical protein